MGKDRAIGYRCEFKHEDSNQCPWCGSTDLVVVGSELAFSDGEDVDEVVCNACHCEWSERSDGFIHQTKKGDAK